MLDSGFQFYVWLPGVLVQCSFFLLSFQSALYIYILRRCDGGNRYRCPPLLLFLSSASNISCYLKLCFKYLIFFGSLVSIIIDLSLFLSFSRRVFQVTTLPSSQFVDQKYNIDRCWNMQFRVQLFWMCWCMIVTACIFSFFSIYFFLVWYNDKSIEFSGFQSYGGVIGILSAKSLSCVDTPTEHLQPQCLCPLQSLAILLRICRSRILQSKRCSK